MESESAIGATAEEDYSDIESEELEMGRPWPRYWARYFDTIVYTLLIAFPVGIIFPEIAYMEVFQGKAGDLLLGLMILPFAMTLDAAVLAHFGTSLGKKIAGLSILPDPGSDRSMERMIRRNLRCYVQGMALGIPFVNLVTLVQSYNRVEQEGTAAWDDLTQTKIVSVPNNGGRTWIIALSAIGLAVVSNYLSRMA